MNLGEKLKQLRKDNNLTQTELSDKLKVSKSTITKWENNTLVPSNDNLEELSKLYKIDSEELINLFKNDIKEKKNKIHMKAKNISLCTLIYFVSFIWLLIGTIGYNLNPILVISIFLTLCAISTSIVVYTIINYKDNEKVINNSYTNNIYLMITLIIYLIISYKTNAWYITWIIWIIYVLLCEIKRLINMLRGNDYEK